MSLMTNDSDEEVEEVEEVKDDHDPLPENQSVSRDRSFHDMRRANGDIPEGFGRRLSIEIPSDAMNELNIQTAAKEETATNLFLMRIPRPMKNKNSGGLRTIRTRRS